MFSRSNWEDKIVPALRNIAGCSQKCRLIVEMEERDPDAVTAVVTRYHGKIVREIELLSSMVIEVPCTALPQLAQLKQVKKIWNDPEVRARGNMSSVQLRSLSGLGFGFTGKGVTVAVLDTGIAFHPDLVTPENRIAGWADFVQQNTTPYDDHGHGTHMAGIIVGNGRSSRGRWAGLAPEARLVGVKVLNHQGAGTLDTLVAGLEWCVRNQELYQIRLINLSCGSNITESRAWEALRRAMRAAWRKGILICCAGSDWLSGLGSLPNGIMVAVGSSTPTEADLLVPDVAVTSLRPLRGYRTFSGTSVATALVSGVAAQLLEQWPRLKPEQLKRLLLKQAPDLGFLPGKTGTAVEPLRRHALPNLDNIVASGTAQNTMPMAPGNGALILINPFSLFLILILLVLSFTSPNPQTNPFLYFLILILLIYSFEPRLALLGGFLH